MGHRLADSQSALPRVSDTEGANIGDTGQFHRREHETRTEASEGTSKYRGRRSNACGWGGRWEERREGRLWLVYINENFNKKGNIGAERHKGLGIVLLSGKGSCVHRTWLRLCQVLTAPYPTGEAEECGRVFLPLLSSVFGVQSKHYRLKLPS